jgi:hypothetical protein
VNLIVDKPTGTLVIDASGGSLCNIVIKNSVENIIVKGNKSSYVSVVFAPYEVVLNNISSQIGTDLQNILGTKSRNKNGDIDNYLNILNSQYGVPSDYQIGTLNIKNINKFEILGIAKGVGFGTIINNAKYFTLNQTKSLLDYSGMQLPSALSQLPSVISNKWQRLLTSNTLIVGELINYGHFLVKTMDISGYTLKNPNKPDEDSISLCTDNANVLWSTNTVMDNTKGWLTNVLVRCKLTSTGRNKNFRIPIGILYLWTGSKVRLCNVSCECIQGPKDCECFDAKCYDSDATNVPFIKCTSVICGYEELDQNKFLTECLTSNHNLLNNEWYNTKFQLLNCTNGNKKSISGCYLMDAWNKRNNTDDNSITTTNGENVSWCHGDCSCDENNNYWYINIHKNNAPTNETCTTGCDGISWESLCNTSDLYYFDPCVVYRAPKHFGCLSVNPCFLNKVELTIRCSDLVICDLVPRVWCAELSNSCPMSCYDDTLSWNCKTTGNNAASMFVKTYLMDLNVDTPAVYVGNKMIGDGFFDSSCLNVKRLVFSQSTPDCWKPNFMNSGNNCLDSNKFSKFRNTYSVMFSKCTDRGL